MSKKIIIVRHAKSSWADFRLKDYDRPLDKRGLKDAPIMAELLKSEGYRPQRLISSSAARAQATASFFSTLFGIDLNTTRSLYHGEPDAYLDQIKLLDESVNTVALFGHNPGITFLANMIKPNVTDNVPTCGIVIAEMPDDTLWSNAEFSKMKITKILTPKNPYA